MNTPQSETPEVHIGELREVEGVAAANALEAQKENGKWVLVMHLKRKDQLGNECPAFVYRLWPKD
jgi:hypothetical protein